MSIFQKIIHIIVIFNLAITPVLAEIQTAVDKNNTDTSTLSTPSISSGVASGIQTTPCDMNMSDMVDQCDCCKTHCTDCSCLNDCSCGHHLSMLEMPTFRQIHVFQTLHISLTNFTVISHFPSLELRPPLFV
jgi:hypothetical protein